MEKLFLPFTSIPHSIPWKKAVFPCRTHSDSRRKILEIDYAFEFGFIIPMGLLPLDLGSERFEWTWCYYIEMWGSFTENGWNQLQLNGVLISIEGEPCLGSGCLPGRTKRVEKDIAPMEGRLINSCLLPLSSQNVCDIFYSTIKVIPM